MKGSQSTVFGLTSKEAVQAQLKHVVFRFILLGLLLCDAVAAITANRCG
jgi:hypothetical protein